MALLFIRLLALLPLCLLAAAAAAVAKPIPPATVSEKEGTKHIQDSCKHTEHPKLCLDSLLTFPESRTADPTQMAGLALRFAATHAANTDDFVTKTADQAGESKGAMLEQCLSECSEHFRDAVEQLDMSTSALERKAYGDVQTWVSAAMSDVTSCNEECEPAGKSPETAEVKKRTDTLFDLCGIALALSRQIPR